MHSAQLELRVVSAIQAKRSGSTGEDDLVEFKREWPPSDDLKSFARQLAGSLNRAGGEPVVVVVGVDDKTGEITNPHDPDLNNWWPSVQKHFDQALPELVRDEIIHLGGASRVHALAIASDRAPYVHKTGKDPATMEVPIREGTRTVSAHRDQIMKMLVPVAGMPSLDVLSASCQALEEYGEDHSRDTDPWSVLRFRCEVEVFVESQPGLSVMFPRHAIVGMLLAGEKKIPLISVGRSAPASDQPPVGVSETTDGYLVSGPGSCRIPLMADVSLETFQTVARMDGPVIIDVRLRAAATNLVAQVGASLSRRGQEFDGEDTGSEIVSGFWDYRWNAAQ